MKTTVLFAILFISGVGALQAETEPMKEFSTIAEARNVLSLSMRFKVRDYSTYDYGRKRDPDRLSILVPVAEQNAILQLLRRYAKRPVFVFVGTTQWHGDERNENLVEVVLGEGSSQFDILRIARSDAINYDMMTEELIKKLRVYDSAYGIDIFHAETDVVEFRLIKKPADLKAFAEELYQFCPDIVDQGTGTVEALIEEISSTNTVYLWWD